MRYYSQQQEGLKYCYKSKCSFIDFCCIKIVRDIGAEVKEDIENKEETTEKKSND
jgi:hypothetical protein